MLNEYVPACGTSPTKKTKDRAAADHDIMARDLVLTDIPSFLILTRTIVTPLLTIVPVLARAVARIDSELKSLEHATGDGKGLLGVRWVMELHKSVRLLLVVAAHKIHAGDRTTCLLKVALEIGCLNRLVEIPNPNRVPLPLGLLLLT